jgi:GH15 family glucan-1,4-alpha-glucosidase
MTMTSRQVPIGDHGLVGDTRSAALVAPDGSIDWWCVPRFDDPPLFGRLVGGDEAGWFSIGPGDGARLVERAYRRDTATLTTTWKVEGAELELADTLIGDVEGRFLPGTLLVRRLTARGGGVHAKVHLAPRFGYGRKRAERIGRRGGALLLEARDLAIAVTSDGPSLEPDRTVELWVDPADPVTIVLTVTRRGPAIIVPPVVAAAEAVRDEERWRGWSEEIVAVTHREAVVRSLITLKLLTYSPSGAPVAAPTTSLPELPGGERNWDYRYAWPRDASIGIAAFLGAGKPSEARAFLAWLLHASRLARPDLAVLFTVDGRPAPPESELAGWPGYSGSRPVRIGNGAAGQHQLDGYGWVIDAAWLLTDAGHRLYGETWRMVAGLADRVAATYTEPDAGIWEKRTDPAHHVHSKLMAWLALDRAGRIAGARGDRNQRRQQRWRKARNVLAEEIRQRAFDPRQHAYTATYGSTDLDGAVLVLPQLDMEAPTSPRVVDTVDAVRRGLSAGGPLLHRYPLGTDGLPGGEGAFLPCSFWLVQALVLTGRADEGAVLLDDLVPLGGPLGLFAEEMEPATGRHLGNYPQALTHAGLVQAALSLDKAFQRSDPPVPPAPGPRLASARMVSDPT